MKKIFDQFYSIAKGIKAETPDVKSAVVVISNADYNSMNDYVETLSGTSAKWRIEKPTPYKLWCLYGICFKVFAVPEMDGHEMIISIERKKEDEQKT